MKFTNLNDVNERDLIVLKAKWNNWNPFNQNQNQVQTQSSDPTSVQNNIVSILSEPLSLVADGLHDLSEVKNVYHHALESFLNSNEGINVLALMNSLNEISRKAKGILNAINIVAEHAAKARKGY